MDRRLKLQILLETIPKVKRVYFQPPTNVKLEYPCIIYKQDYDQTHAADNSASYFRAKRYSVTVIDRNPDSDIPDKVAALPLTKLVRTFTSDGLNHQVFNLYF